MTASETKALIAGFVVVSVAGAGALIWRQQHPNSAETARLEGPAPASQPALTPVPVKPQTPQKQHDASKPEASKPVVLPPKGPDLGIAPAAPKPAEPAAGGGEPPHFDVVRVEPSGETVIAGKGDPKAKIELLGSGKVIGETTADAGGNFVILPSALTPGNYDLSLRQTSTGHPVAQSTQSVAVSVPASGGQVVVALAEPGKPTKLISGPPQAPAASPGAPGAPPAQTALAKPDASAPTPTPPVAPPAAPSPRVALAKPDAGVPVPAKPVPPVPLPAAKPAAQGLVIRSVELENGNGFFASGAAAPGTHIQVYLNGSHLAEVIAGPDGQWSVTIKKGLTGGHYAVRADATGESGAVTARVEVPFDVPAEMAQAPKPEAPKPEAQTPEPPVAAAQSPTPEPQAPEPAPAAATPSPVANTGPEPPSAPNPSEIAGLGPDMSIPVDGPPVETQTPTEPPKPRPDIASAGQPMPATAQVPQMAMTPAKPAAAPPTPAPVAPLVATRPAAAPPTLTAAAPVIPKQAEAGPAVPSAHAVIDEIETALVVPGDNLWNISRARLGRGRRFTEVYAANVTQIRDPKLIYPGQVFVVPAK